MILASPDRVISAAVLRLLLFVVIAKLAGAAKEIALAAFYGVSPTMDAYLFNFSVASTLSAVWFGVLSLILVPLLIRQTANQVSDALLFREELIGTTVLVGIALALVYAFLMPRIAYLPALQLPSSTAAIAAAQSPVLSSIVPLGLAVGLATCFLMALGKHVPALTEAVPALVLLSFVVGLQDGGSALITGTVAGWAAQFAVLVFILWRLGHWPRVRWSHQSPHWRTLWTAMGALAVGHILSSLTEVADNFYAAGFGEGSISLLAYANRVLGIVTAIGATVLTRATLPIFSASFSISERNYRSLIFKWATLGGLFGALSLLAGWHLAPWIVEVLFQRGAFDGDDSARVASLFRLALLQLPVFLSGVVLVNGLAAAGRYQVIGLIAALNLGVKLAANTLLIQRLGIEGLPISTAIMYASAFVCCVVAFQVLARKTHK